MPTPRLYETQQVTVTESYVEGRTPRKIEIDIRDDDTVSAVITWRRLRVNEDGTCMVLGEEQTDVAPGDFESFFARFIVDDPASASFAEARQTAVAEWVAAQPNPE
jgi:hypothetical protein